MGCLTAVRERLEPTKRKLQESAFALLDRLIDPGRIHDVPTEGLTPEWDAELAYLEAIRG